MTRSVSVSGFARSSGAELMVQVQRGDEQSFDALLRTYRIPVVQYLTRLVRNHAIAEELAQDVFMRVYRSRYQYQPSAKFSTWLYRITTNVALNHFRDERRYQNDISLDDQSKNAGWKAVDSTPLIEKQMLRDALAGEIRSAIGCLPVKQRAAVIMHKYLDLDYAQIAAALGCTPSAVKALMFRAYEALRGRLTPAIAFRISR